MALFVAYSPPTHSPTRLLQPYAQVLPISSLRRASQRLNKPPKRQPPPSPPAPCASVPRSKAEMESLTRLVTNSLRNPGGVTKLWSFSLADPSQGRRERLHKVRVCWRRKGRKGGSDEGERERTCGSPCNGFEEACLH